MFDYINTFIMKKKKIILSVLLFICCLACTAQTTGYKVNYVTEMMKTENDLTVIDQYSVKQLISIDYDKQMIVLGTSKIFQIVDSVQEKNSSGGYDMRYIVFDKYSDTPYPIAIYFCRNERNQINYILFVVEAENYTSIMRLTVYETIKLK